MMRIAIYSRKSIETDTGESIQNQINMCKQYFERQYQDCKFEIFEDEGFSGGNINRPSFKRMMDLVKIKQFDIVAVYKIDRIARNIVDFVNVYDSLDKLNVKLVSITEGFDPSTPAGKMMMLLLASFAEMERMNIAQRVKDNMVELAKMGRWSGGSPPSGYSVEKVIENGKTVSYLKKENDAENIKEIFQKYAQGFTAFEISKYFQQKGIKYNPKTIYGILTNPSYLIATEESVRYLESQKYTVYGTANGCGFLPYNRRPRLNGKKLWKDDSKFVGISRHEAVIDLEIWIKVQEQLNKKSVEPHPHESSFSFLTGGLVKCPCGSGMGVSPSAPRKDGSRRYYFKCSSKRYKKSNCSSSSLRVDVLENKVLEFLTNICNKEKLIDHMEKSKENKNLVNEIKSINKKITSNNKSIDNLVNKLMLLSNAASKSVTNKIEEITKENEYLKEELLKLEREKLFNSLDTANIDTIYNNIKQFLNTSPMDLKKRLIKTILEKVIWNYEENEVQIFLKR